MDCVTFKKVLEDLGDKYDPTVEKREPWNVILRTILSQNTTDDNSREAYERLVEEHETPDEILEADAEEVERLIRPAGLAPSKSEYIRNAARYIVEERNRSTDWIEADSSDFEDAYDELTSIKGIGHKTADVVLLFSSDANICPVDTHVQRVTSRLGVADGLSRRKTRDLLLDLRDDCGLDLRDAHLSLIRHGREVCTPRSPSCDDCIVSQKCERVGVED
ncbi:endonuclease III [Halorutilales archaeon Cl-col2-1]